MLRRLATLGDEFAAAEAKGVTLDMRVGDVRGEVPCETLLDCCSSAALTEGIRSLDSRSGFISENPGPISRSVAVGKSETCLDTS